MSMLLPMEPSLTPPHDAWAERADEIAAELVSKARPFLGALLAVYGVPNADDLLRGWLERMEEQVSHEIYTGTESYNDYD